MKSYVQWLLGARNWITVIIERSDHSLVTYWGLNFCWWLFTTFWYVIFKKTYKIMYFWNLKKRKIRILEHCCGVQRVCCCGPCGQAMSIDCCTARLRVFYVKFWIHIHSITAVSSKGEQCHVYSDVGSWTQTYSPFYVHYWIFFIYHIHPMNGHSVGIYAQFFGTIVRYDRTTVPTARP